MVDASAQLISDVELTVFWMLVAVAVVALVTKRIRVPYTIALVIAGLILALFPGTPNIQLTPDLIVAVFLPTLIFEAAYNLHFGHLRENLRPVTILAIPGVLLTATIVAALMHFAGGLPWEVAFLFGAIVSATDPVSVVALFREMGTPGRLRTILEGESLFNDGTAIVVFNLILGIVLAGRFDPAASLFEFALVVAGGLVLGLVVGYACSFLLRQVDDYLLETILTIILAYGTYFLAQQLHVSGIIAVVAAGLLVGNYGRQIAFSPSSRIAVGLSWELFAFIANSLIFLFVGLQIRGTNLTAEVGAITLAVIAVVLARTVVVTLAAGYLRLRRADAPVPWSWQVVLIWGGLRGALSLALALSIPAQLDGGRGPFPQRALILVLTFSVILFTLLVPGLTMRPLLERLRLAGRGEDLVEYEATQARLRAARAALQTLETHTRSGQINPDLAEELRVEYQHQTEALGEFLAHLDIRHGALRRRALVAERRALLLVEKSTLRDLQARGEIDDATLQELTGDVDRRLAELSAEPPSATEPDEARMEPPGDAALRPPAK